MAQDSFNVSYLNEEDIDLFQAYKSTLFNKQVTIPSEFQWIASELQSLSRHTHQSMKTMMNQIRQLGAVQETDELQRLARQLNQILQQSGMEYMRKMSWIADKLRRQAILYSSSNLQDSICLEDSLLQDAENSENQQILRPLTMNPKNNSAVTTRANDKKQKETSSGGFTEKTTWKPLKSVDETHSTESHHAVKEAKIVNKENLQSFSQSYDSNTSASQKADKVKPKDVSKDNETIESPTEIKQDTDTREKTTVEEPMLQSVKDRVKIFSQVIQEQEKNRDLVNDGYIKPTKNQATFNNKKDSKQSPVEKSYQTSQLAETSVTWDSLLTSERQKDQKGEKSAYPKQETITANKNQSQDYNNSQSTCNWSNISSSFRQVDVSTRSRKNSESSLATKSVSSQQETKSKHQLWQNISTEPLEPEKYLKHGKNEKKTAPKSLLLHKPNLKDAIKETRREDSSSLFSAIKTSWSKVAKSGDVHIKKFLNNDKPRLEQSPSLSLSKEKSAIQQEAKDQLSTLQPSSLEGDSVSHIRRPAVPLYPIQDANPMEPSAPALFSGNASFVSQGATNGPWIECQTTDGTPFQWNMLTQEVKWI